MVEPRLKENVWPEAVFFPPVCSISPLSFSWCRESIRSLSSQSVPSSNTTTMSPKMSGYLPVSSNSPRDSESLEDDKEKEKLLNGIPLSYDGNGSLSRWHPRTWTIHASVTAINIFMLVISFWLFLQSQPSGMNHELQQTSTWSKFSLHKLHFRSVPTHVSSSPLRPVRLQVTLNHRQRHPLPKNPPPRSTTTIPQPSRRHHVG